jgi:hypothetical protein
MTEHHRSTPADGRPPTARQQRYLRQLAVQRGVTFTLPTTSAEASRLIDELKRRDPEPPTDRRRELRAVQADMASGRGDDARVREELEVTGYGASATWKRGQS